MLNPRDKRVGNLGELKGDVLKQAKLELKMSLSLLEMLKGNTQLQDLAKFRQEWNEPLERLIKELEKLTGCGRTIHSTVDRIGAQTFSQYG